MGRHTKMAFIPASPAKLLNTRLTNPFPSYAAPVRVSTFLGKGLSQLPRQRAKLDVTPALSSTLTRTLTTMASSQGSNLPQLYVYDHCPFCVRVRHALGYKGVKYNLVWLLNDDVETPTSLVGRKMVPIFQPDGSDGKAMAESLDICKMVDEDSRFGQTSSIHPGTERKDISEWLDSLADPMRRLTRPRFALADKLPEFTFEDGRAAFVRNHQLKTEPISFDENLARSDDYISKITQRLPELGSMVSSPQSISEIGFSYDDIVTFAKLRALTIVKGLKFPSNVQAYLEYQSKMASIPLYDHIAM